MSDQTDPGSVKLRTGGKKGNDQIDTKAIEAYDRKNDILLKHEINAMQRGATDLLLDEMELE